MYKCWHCKKEVEAIYDDDLVCYDCLEDMVDRWQDKVVELKIQLKHAQERLEKAQMMFDARFERRDSHG